MVISTFNEGWEERLALLRRCIAERPDGPVWLWTIRVRILEFLATRHRKEASSSDALREFAPRSMVEALGETDQDVEDALGPATPWHSAPLAASAHPPRMRQAINPVLERLQDVNDANRMRLDRNAPLQNVWLWWREAWCCRAT